MKFSPGDKILLKRTGEEGHVIAYINKQMLEVEVNGTLFPVHSDDIDHPYLKWFTDKASTRRKAGQVQEILVERPADRQSRLARGIYLSFIPVFKTEEMEEVVDHLKVYLLNELPLQIKYIYDVRLQNRSEFRHEGLLHAFGNVYLHSVSYPDMNEQPRFHWQLEDTANPGMEKAEGILRIRPAKLFEQVDNLLSAGQPSFSYLLIEDFTLAKKAAVVEKFEVPAASSQPPLITARTIEPARQEIDLHIDELLPNKRGLSNAEILLIQLNTLQRYIQLAIVHRQERMVVIHGLGKGKLKDEVHAILKKIPEVARFKNEWSGRYGFGATEIWFRYK